jgi:hypothetical protein
MSRPATPSAFASLLSHPISLFLAVLRGLPHAAAPAAIVYDLVPVGNAGNANDPATGNVYGAVAYDYQIGKF